jgi:hypothetical protein
VERRRDDAMQSLRSGVGGSLRHNGQLIPGKQQLVLVDQQPD